MSYQTLVVLVLSLAAFTFGLISANEQALGITSPWLTLVVIPSLLAAITLASNQMKTIGQPPPGTVKTTTEQTTTPSPTP